MSMKTAPHLLYEVQDQRVRPEHDCNTCWSTRAPTQTTKAGLEVEDKAVRRRTGWTM
ncbi:hypothetical protein DPMN_171014 [Dreissena polymorpha]|uniref:Uncharacterized protein n=1 Tax=Dreissena polymorpha TaxID=45954 RepID=A0A9D4E0H3_DREPO|nr:hypothetical protein DPMN_171014 [Dreissena polymorpha]